MSQPQIPSQGDFGPLQASRLITGITTQSQSACIRCVQGKASRSVWIRDGEVLAVTSTLPEERLGAWLVARDLVDRKTLEDILANKSPDQRLGSVLVQRRHLTTQVLERELDSLTLRLAAKLTLSGGSYKVDTETPLPDDLSTVAYEPQALMVAAVRRLPDAGQFEELTGGARVWEIVPGTEQQGADASLSGLEKFLLTQLASAHTLTELQNTSPQHAREIPRALVSLVVQGRVGEQKKSPHVTTAAESTAYPPASPRLRQLLTEIDPHPTRKVAGPTVPVAPGKGQPLDPEQAEQNKERAYVMLGEGGDQRAAHKLLAQAVEVAPDANALTVLAELEIHNPLWRPRALARLKQATQMAPQHTGAWLALANYWSLRLQPDKQRRCLEKVLSYEPRNEEARQTLELLGPDRGS